MTPDEMLAEADRLVELQREARGTVAGKTVEGKPCVLPGPMIRTKEIDARAQKIIRLRRRAARLKYPI